MPRLGRIFILSAAAVLSELAPPVDAHGHDHASPGTESGSTGAVSNGTMHSISDSDRVPSYFGLSSYSESISAHIALMITAWVFLLPLCVMLSIARSRFTFPLQIVFLAVNAGGLVTGTIYNANTPDLYQNNAHHKLGWIVTWMVSGQVALGLVGLYNRHFGSRAGEFVQRESYFPVSVDAMATHQRTHLLQSSHTDRFSEDSGQGTERSSTTLRSPTGEEQRSREQLMSDAEEDGQAYDSEGLGRGMEKPSFLPGSAAHRFLASKLTGILSRRATRVCMFVYETLNRTILIVGFVALTSGIVTYGGLFRGRQIFNGLAHFIKGGIFFWYGLLTLGRWMGCFADIGWAWNLKPSKAAVGQGKGNAPSAEFVEAFLYFLYGSTNVFLEHLGHWGGTYTGQDLEHISISILAFGGGLCGMLVESRRVSDLLNSQANDIAARSTENFNRADGKWDYSPTSKISMNPMPGIVTLLLGVIMSSHHQESMTATMVHAQWGNLLVAASLARAVTYLIFFLSPPKSILPSRPPSELVTSFCLISGGIIFMASNADTISTMERYDLGPMFIFTVTMGATGLLMSWMLGLLALKGWAEARELRSRLAPASSPSSLPSSAEAAEVAAAAAAAAAATTAWSHQPQA